MQPIPSPRSIPPIDSRPARARRPATREPSAALQAMRQRYTRSGDAPTPGIPVEPPPLPGPAQPIEAPEPARSRPAYSQAFERRLARALGIDDLLYADRRDPTRPAETALETRQSAAWLLFLMGHGPDDAHLEPVPGRTGLQLVIDRPDRAWRRLERSLQQLRFHDFDRPDSIPLAMSLRLASLDVTLLQPTGPDDPTGIWLDDIVGRIERARSALAGYRIEVLDPHRTGSGPVELDGLPEIRAPRTDTDQRDRAPTRLHLAESAFSIQPTRKTLAPVLGQLGQLMFDDSREQLGELAEDLVEQQQTFQRSMDIGLPDIGAWIRYMRTRGSLLRTIEQLQVSRPEPALDRLVSAVQDLPVVTQPVAPVAVDGPPTRALSQALGQADFPWPPGMNDAERYRLQTTLRSFEACWQPDPTPRQGSFQRLRAFATKTQTCLDALIEAWPSSDHPSHQRAQAWRQQLPALQIALQGLVSRLDELHTGCQLSIDGPSALDSLSETELCRTAQTDMSSPDLLQGLRAGWTVNDIVEAHRRQLPAGCMPAATLWVQEEKAVLHLPDVAELLLTLGRMADTGTPPSPGRDARPQDDLPGRPPDELISELGVAPDYLRAGLQAGWSADEVAHAWDLQCPAWTLPLASQLRRETGRSALALAWATAQIARR